MASENRIDSIYDVAKITAEQQAVEKLVRESIEQIKQARSQSIDFNVNTKSLADYNKKVTDLNSSLATMKTTVAATTAATTANTQATQQANGTLQQNIELRRRLQGTLNSYLKDQKEDITLLKSGVISRAEYNKRLTESQAKAAIYKQKIAELNRVVKEDIAIEGRAGDAYKQLSAEYNRAALAAKNYQITLGASNPITQQAVARAKGLSDQLKAVDNAVGQNGRNVGNYQSAIVNAFGKTFSFLRTAANLIPGLGIGGLIGGIAIGILEVGKALFTTNKAFDEGKVFAEAYKNTLVEVGNEAIKQSTADITKLEFYQSILTDVTQSQQNRTQALQAYNKIADESNQIDVSQINNLDLINEKINKQITLIEKRALSRAAESILADKAEKFLLAREKARLDEEEKLNLDIEAGRSVIAEAIDVRTGKVIKSSQAFIDIEKKRAIEGRINANEAVKNAKTEFDASKKALYDLLKVEGFVADETKKIKEKKAKEPKGKDIAEANRKAQFEILKSQIELDKEFDLIRANDERKTFVDRLANLINYGADSQRLIEAQAEFDLGNAKLTSLERQKIESDKNNTLIRLSFELNEKLKKIQQDNFKTGTDTLPVDSRIPKELQKILDDFTKAQKKAIDDAANNAKRLKEALKGAFQSLTTEVSGLFFDIFQNAAEREKNAIQDQIDLLEQQKQKDIELANQTITNAQDKADAIAVIEARAAAKKQQLELKQRQLDQQKARFEKASAVASVVQGTTIAVINALGAKPWTPANIALAAVVGAIGAVQIARIIAQPIPRYRDGTENHPGGLAVVGDGGKSETVVLPDGSLYRTPSKDTLVDLPKGSQVIPDYASRPQNISILEPVDNTDKLMQGFASVVYAVKRIPQPIIRADRAWTQAHKIGSSYRNYLNRSI